MGAVYEPGKALFWKYFEEISQIPRGSGNITGISNYLAETARKMGLDYVQDEIGNVVVYKPASDGYEAEPGVILQGHMDMVTVKKDDCELDLTKDALELAVDGDSLYAKGTSLGADDGIAMAYALAILEDESIKHPYLEAVFTVDEETGMDGAAALDEKLLKARRMINIDNGEEGVLITGCAGGSRISASLPVEWKERTANVYELRVSGLKGGHSGTEINTGRVSAITVLARFLCELKTVRTRIMELECGEKDNVIADSGYVKFICSAPMPDVCETVQFYADVLKEEFAVREPDLVIDFRCLGQGVKVRALHKEDSNRIMDLLLGLPQGIREMSIDVKGLVETSDNVGTAKLNEGSFDVTVSVRSLFESARQALCDKVIAVATLAGAATKQSGDYPCWTVRKSSPLRDKAIKAYREMTGSRPKAEAIHAGLECGIFADKLEDLDCISLGPDMKNIHTADESLSISSAERVYGYILKILEEK